MSIVDINLEQVVNRVVSDMKSHLTNLDPTIKNTFANALAISLANRSYDYIIGLQQVEDQFFPQTAEGEFLDRWAGYEGLTRQAPTSAEGYINVSGDAGISIPLETEFDNSGNIYKSTVAATTDSKTINVSSLTRSGYIATATTSNNHSLASGQDVTISGSLTTGYNGTYTITVAGLKKFTYTITTLPDATASGTITANWTGAQVPVESEDSGTDMNLSSGATLTIVDSIEGIDNEAYAQYLGIVGGSDEETDEALRSRVMQSRANPVTNFNSAAIEKKAREVNGVTRVYVKEIYPEVGDVTVLFVRDNDEESIIPSESEIAEVKSAIVEIMPANTSESYIHVDAPSITSVDFVFESITPWTTTMEAAITNSLESYFENLEFEEDVKEHQYVAAIQNTVDLTTGEAIEDFILNSPVGDVTVSGLSLGVLNSVSFA